MRLERGGEVLCPGDGSDRVQVIDVRDLAEFTIRTIEQGIGGTFNLSPTDHNGLTIDAFAMLTVKDGKFVMLGE